MKLIKKLFLSLAMLMTMSVSANAQGSQETKVTDKGTLTVDGVTYQLYYIENIYYYPSPDFQQVLSDTLMRRSASVKNFPSGVEEITIPSTVTNGNEVYSVSSFACTMQANGTESYGWIGSISLKVLRFEGSVSMASSSSYAWLNFPNLTDLYLVKPLPSLTQAYKYYFPESTQGTVTLHVKGFTKEEVATLKTQAPWSGFKDIVGGTASTSLTLFAGNCNKAIEVWGDDEKVATIPQEGGSVWNLDLTKEYIELRIPNTYLEKIIINGEDVTQILQATTPTDPAYQGYTFYRMYEFPEQMIVEVKCRNASDPPTHHQPQIMIMRSGVGNILFQGMYDLSQVYDNEAWVQQAKDAYVQEFGYPVEENGWVVSAVANCQDAVTTVTVPDEDYLGNHGGIDAIAWGFRAKITPRPGEKVNKLLLGWIDKDEDGRSIIQWEDMLIDYGIGNYLTDNNDGTYTFAILGDEMNWWVGDYILNIGMGPDETVVETGATLNFVRQGGRGDSFIEWYDESGRDFYFEEGSTSKTIPNEELQDNDLKMYINIEQGEALHVYKNGQDITSQFQLNGQSTTQYWLLLKPESATYTLLIDDAPNANPTWTIHNATEADVIVEQTLKDGTTTTSTYAGNLNDLVIDDTQVSKVTLKVYAENQNESKPVRVLVNGQDVSYQFSTNVNDGDGFRLCYEVPVSELTNCSWDISYNTDHAQTFVVKGGSREPLVEVERELLYGGPNLCIFRNDGPATIYLPPFNSEYNSNIDMVVYANAGEGVTIKRNGVDVTALFEEKAASGYKYYDLDINDADFEGDNTVSQFGFDIRDAAVWEIVYRSIDEQMKTLRVSNLDQMEIVYERNYTDGSTVSEYFKNAETGEIAKYVERFFDDSDRENTRFIYLHVPIPESLPIRVLCNGEDVTYSKHDEWINGDWVTYIASMTQDQTWDISYDTSHKQTFIVKGGQIPKVNYEYKASDIFKDVQVGGITEVFLPDYNPDYDNTYAYFTIVTLPNESFAALRNGVDVTDKFTKEETPDNKWIYSFSFDNAEVAAALGVDLRDPAVWQITVGDTERFDVNRDGSISIADVTTLVNKILGKPTN